MAQTYGWFRSLENFATLGKTRRDKHDVTKGYIHDMLNNALLHEGGGTSEIRRSCIPVVLLRRRTWNKD